MNEIFENKKKKCKNQPIRKKKYLDSKISKIKIDKKFEFELFYFFIFVDFNLNNQKNHKNLNKIIENA